MATAYLYENDTDQNQHSRAMQTLARELGMREEEDTETLRGNAWRVQSRGKDKKIFSHPSESHCRECDRNNQRKQ